jgi:hypothetical protein
MYYNILLLLAIGSIYGINVIIYSATTTRNTYCVKTACCVTIATNVFSKYVPQLKGRGYFAGLRVTKRNKATVLLTLTLFQTPTLTLTLILTHI